MKKYCRVYSMILVLLLVLSGALTLQGAMAESQLTVDLRGLNLVEGRNWRSVALHGVFDVADAQGNYLGSVTANSPEGSGVTVPEGTIVLTPRMESLPAGYAFESSYTAQVSETRSAVILLAYKAEGLFEVRHGYEDGTPAVGGEFVLQDAFGQQAMAFATDAQGFYAANEPIPAGVYTVFGGMAGNSTVQ